MSKRIHIIAGPNGAGKTSHARVALLPDFLGSNEFVNADEIAKILSSGNPEKSAIEASRLMLKRMEFLLASGMSFALETTSVCKNLRQFYRESSERWLQGKPNFPEARKRRACKNKGRG